MVSLYGALFRQVAARAGAGVLYPSYLDSRSLGTPRVQYQETDWEFLKRMAGHFGLPLYPEPTGGGARVSLYFKNGDESSATAVNCIRQEGEGAENEYRKRSLRTEHQKELKLYPDHMGVISLDAHVLLDDLEGPSVRRRKT